MEVLHPLYRYAKDRTGLLVWIIKQNQVFFFANARITLCPLDAIVFVVDSVDVERMEEAKMELMRTAKSPDNSQVPILILANKQDLPGARDPKEIEKHLGLHELGTGHLYHVQPACAITGEGLDDGLDILYEMIHKRKKHSKMTRNKNKIPTK